MTKDSALIIPYNGYQVLLQLRDYETSNRPNKWSFFGGSIESSETPLEAATRELYEELGVMSPNLTFFRTVYRKKMSGNFYKHFFSCFMEYPEPFFQSQLREGRDTKFFHFEELPTLPIKYFDKEILLDFFSQVIHNKISYKTL